MVRSLPASLKTDRSPWVPLLPFSNIVLACGYLEGCLEAISHGGISNTELSLKKPWKGIFTEGRKETAKGNYTRQGPPEPSSPALPLHNCPFSHTSAGPHPLCSFSFSLLPTSPHPPSLLFQAPFPPPRSQFSSCGTIWPVLGCWYSTQTPYMTEPAWQILFLEGRWRKGQRDRAGRGGTLEHFPFSPA